MTAFLIYSKHFPISWFSWYIVSVIIVHWIFDFVSWVLLRLVSDMPLIWKLYFDFNMGLFNSSKWNDNKLMCKWNKEKILPIVLNVEFRSLVLKYLVMLFSELTALMKFSASEIAGFAIWVNFNLFLRTVYLNSLLFKIMYGRNFLGQYIENQWNFSQFR